MQNDIFVHTTENMPDPNKDDVRVFVLGSSQGSLVRLSEVKVAERSVPFDSLCRGVGVMKVHSRGVGVNNGNTLEAVTLPNTGFSGFLW